jgi:hypothetical protein
VDRNIAILESSPAVVGVSCRLGKEIAAGQSCELFYLLALPSWALAEFDSEHPCNSWRGAYCCADI